MKRVCRACKRRRRQVGPRRTLFNSRTPRGVKLAADATPPFPGTDGQPLRKTTLPFQVAANSKAPVRLGVCVGKLRLRAYAVRQQDSRATVQLKGEAGEAGAVAGAALSLHRSGLGCDEVLIACGHEWIKASLITARLHTKADS